MIETPAWDRLAAELVNTQAAKELTWRKRDQLRRALVKAGGDLDELPPWIATLVATQIQPSQIGLVREEAERGKK